MSASELCPAGTEDDPCHCGHWYECEPCHRCGDDTPDPGCDCPRCTYDRQARDGYPSGGLRQSPDLDAPWPSGMCGKKKKCDTCPSSFLCFIKAGDEFRKIKARAEATEADR